MKVVQTTIDIPMVLLNLRTEFCRTHLDSNIGDIYFCSVFLDKYGKIST